MTTTHRRLALEYVIPLRWSDDADLAEFSGYLAQLSRIVDLTVVDGSDHQLFTRHAAAWHRVARHLPVGEWPGRNRKVAGVVTGVLAARHDRVVIADDDVRCGREQLVDIAARLDRAELVRLQNVFRPLPWRARWDSGRILLNRAFGSDYPGTLGVRCSAFVAAGGYDGDVLLENLQLIRTITAAGGREDRADGLFVARRPCTARRFLEQRVRQAYDGFAQPARRAVEASLLPAIVLTVRRRPRALPLLAVAVIGTAEIGRRRAAGTTAFDATSAFWAPLWTVERAVTIWMAVAASLSGGARYRGDRIPVAATRPRPAPLAGVRDTGGMRSGQHDAEPRSLATAS